MVFSGSIKIRRRDAEDRLMSVACSQLRPRIDLHTKWPDRTGIDGLSNSLSFVSLQSTYV